jgi:hypothetical protein
MGWVGGELGVVYIVGISYFGAAAILFSLGLLRTKRQYLRAMLCYTVLSCIALAACTLMLGFNLTLTARSDGASILWLRWLFYAIIYGLCGITQVLCELSCQSHHWQHWLTSLLFGAAFVGPAVASTLGDVSQRIIALCLSAIPYVCGVFALWSLAMNLRVRVCYLLSLFIVGMATYGLWFAIGASGFSVRGNYNLMWESATYLMIDAIMFTLLPALACVVHGPCIVDTKHDPDHPSIPLTAPSPPLPTPATTKAGAPLGFFGTPKKPYTGRNLIVIGEEV